MIKLMSICFQRSISLTMQITEWLGAQKIENLGGWILPRSIFSLPFQNWNWVRVLWFCRYISYPMFNSYKFSNYKYKHHCDHDVPLGCPAPYERRHVVPSAVSLAGMYASPAKETGSRCRVSVARSNDPTKPAFCRYRQGKLVFYIFQNS